MSEEMKQVIVVRKDLNMRKGKIAAQVAHASLGVVVNLLHDRPKERKGTGYYLGGSIPIEVYEWLQGPFTKIVVSCDSEEELVGLHEAAKKNGLLTCLITDAGKTEFNNIPTKTTCAIGPGKVQDINKITGHLPLL